MSKGLLQLTGGTLSMSAEFTEEFDPKHYSPEKARGPVRRTPSDRWEFRMNGVLVGWCAYETAINMTVSNIKGISDNDVEWRYFDLEQTSPDVNNPEWKALDDNFLAKYGTSFEQLKKWEGINGWHIVLALVAAFAILFLAAKFVLAPMVWSWRESGVSEPEIWGRIAAGAGVIYGTYWFFFSRK